MKSPVIKRSIVIAKHKTSVSVEDVFWSSLKKIATESGHTLSSLVGRIDDERPTGNLSSAIRTFVLRHYRQRCEAVEVGLAAARAPLGFAGNGRAHGEIPVTASLQEYGRKFDRG